MKAADIREWRNHFRYSKQEAAEILGISEQEYEEYENGQKQIPRYIALACSAIAEDLDTYDIMHKKMLAEIMHNLLLEIEFQCEKDGNVEDYYCALKKVLDIDVKNLFCNDVRLALTDKFLQEKDIVRVEQIFHYCDEIKKHLENSHDSKS